jgi:hypothetical protein
MAIRFAVVGAGKTSRRQAPRARMALKKEIVAPERSERATFGRVLHARHRKLLAVKDYIHATFLRRLAMKPVGIYLAVKLNKIPGRIAHTQRCSQIY